MKNVALRKPSQILRKARPQLAVGGRGDNCTLESIAMKYRVPLRFLETQLRAGIRVELEHTVDLKLAREIAMDHLAEIPDYYSRLRTMEDDAKA